MPRKKGVLILALLCFFLPTFSYAQEEATQVGIGFRSLETPKKSFPSDRVTPMANVLPSTSTARNANTPSSASRETLPKTGERQSSWLRFIGVICLTVCYWIFLFLKMKEEEECYDKET